MFIPIISAVVGLVLGLSVIGLLGHIVSVPSIAPTLATMIGLGVGIDYALFVVSRHRENMAQGMDPRESVALAVGTAGTAVVFAGGTLVLALLALAVAGIPLISSLGYGSALAVVSAVLGSVAGLSAVQACLSHFNVMVKKTSQVFVAGPKVVEQATGREISKEDLGDERIQVKNGVVMNLAEDEQDAIAQVRRFLSYLPSSVYQMPPRIECDDDPERRTPMDRMRKEGYTKGAGENCMRGGGGPEAAHNGWCHSSGHHRNLLYEGHTEMGTALSGSYWVQNFGGGEPYTGNLTAQ